MRNSRGRSAGLKEAVPDNVGNALGNSIGDQLGPTTPSESINLKAGFASASLYSEEPLEQGATGGLIPGNVSAGNKPSGAINAGDTVGGYKTYESDPAHAGSYANYPAGEAVIVTDSDNNKISCWRVNDGKGTCILPIGNGDASTSNNGAIQKISAANWADSKFSGEPPFEFNDLPNEAIVSSNPFVRPRTILDGPLSSSVDPMDELVAQNGGRRGGLGPQAVAVAPGTPLETRSPAQKFAEEHGALYDSPVGASLATATYLSGGSKDLQGAMFGLGSGFEAFGSATTGTPFIRRQNDLTGSSRPIIGGQAARSTFVPYQRQSMAPVPGSQLASGAGAYGQKSSYQPYVMSDGRALPRTTSIKVNGANGVAASESSAGIAPGDFTAVKFQGDRTYALRPSNDGTGPLRWERTNPEVRQPSVHGNSLSNPDPTHVYAIIDDTGAYWKIGESAGELNGSGLSLRAESQVRDLNMLYPDKFFTSEIRNMLPNKAVGRAYETRMIERYRSMYGQDLLPGNLTNR